MHAYIKIYSYISHYIIHKHTLCKVTNKIPKFETSLSCRLFNTLNIPKHDKFERIDMTAF